MPISVTHPPAVAAFLEQLGALPIREWLRVRDRMRAGDASAALDAYRRACDVAAAAGLTPARRAAEDEVRRLTDTIAWAATYQPDGEAITRRDLGAMQILAEWAVTAIVTRGELGETDFLAMMSAFAPHVDLGGASDDPSH